MLFVPRRRGSFESISVNGLGFAGALLAKDDEELARLREVGPMTVLREVALG
jgi:ATP adenylyltransferase